MHKKATITIKLHNTLIISCSSQFQFNFNLKLRLESDIGSNYMQFIPNKITGKRSSVKLEVIIRVVIAHSSQNKGLEGVH